MPTTTKTIQIKQRIMFVCEQCEDEAPECCGHFDPKQIGVTADDRWLCEGCWDAYVPDVGVKPPFSSAPHPLPIPRRYS